MHDERPYGHQAVLSEYGRHRHPACCSPFRRCDTDLAQLAEAAEYCELKPHAARELANTHETVLEWSPSSCTASIRPSTVTGRDNCHQQSLVETTQAGLTSVQSRPSLTTCCRSSQHSPPRVLPQHSADKPSKQVCTQMPGTMANIHTTRLPPQ